VARPYGLAAVLPSRMPARSSAVLRAGCVPVIEVDGRQVLHVLPGDLELDAVVGAGHRRDRDGYFLAAPQVSLLEEHVGHVTAAGVDDEALDLADVPVSGLDVITAAES